MKQRKCKDPASRQDSKPSLCSSSNATVEVHIVQYMDMKYVDATDINVNDPCRCIHPWLYIRIVLCVVFSSHSFWTSSSLDVPAGVTQKEGHTGFFIHLLSAVGALMFLARRVQTFLSLVDRVVESCVLTI